jgi:glycosyltransferase involved in cell wall biosynthesis
MPGAVDAPAETRPRRRVLISAYAFAPNIGSEPGIGWNIASKMAAHHDVTVICGPKFGDGEQIREEFEKAWRDHTHIPGLTVFHIDPPPLSRWFQRPWISFATPLFFIGYASWQKKAFAKAKRLQEQYKFDLVHQLTYTGFREPGHLWKLGVPFVWGPIAGASDIPWSYFRILGWRDRCFYALKNIVNKTQKRWLIRPRKAARAARRVFVVGQDNRSLVTERWGVPSHIMLDTGSPSGPGRPRRYDGKRPLRIVWSGLHVGRKALPLLFWALDELGDYAKGRVELTILGGGSQTDAWRTLAKKLTLEPCIHWTGHLPRHQALARMDEADIFVFTSLQEGTSSVVLEALSMGLPVICHDACGMAAAVDKTCGVKIPMRGPRESVREFADAIRSVLDEPPLVERLSIGALARAEALSWERKVEDIAATYEEVLTEIENDKLTPERTPSHHGLKKSVNATASL